MTRRLRTIKPGLYENEELAQCSIAARYSFPGLWTIADREGRLEDRPLRIKAQILPYDDVDMNMLLDELAVRGFIQRYSVEGRRFIAIPTWSRHQKPHQREAASEIPPPPPFEAPPRQCLGMAQATPVPSLGRDEPGGILGLRSGVLGLGSGVLDSENPLLRPISSRGKEGGSDDDEM
jgi:hypothetical protein